MARYILLSIVFFIAIVFLFTALKGVIRRLAGIPPKQKSSEKPAKKPETQASQVIFTNNSTTVLQGEAKQNPKR